MNENLYQKTNKGGFGIPEIIRCYEAVKIAMIGSWFEDIQVNRAEQVINKKQIWQILWFKPRMHTLDSNNLSSTKVVIKV